jgi:shikimate dehydrogenase
MQFGLIGKSLKHSFSADFFTKKFEELQLDYKYDLFELDNITEFENLCLEKKLRGLNVTIPYKQTIIPFIDELSPEARAIGAVNTIIFSEGKMIGHNTDVAGFELSLTHFFQKNQAKKAVILGDGGAAKAVAFVLHKMGFEFLIISRKKDQNTIGWNELTKDMVKEFPLWINTTPVGNFPNINEILPLPYNNFSNQNFYFDLIYNPAKTATAIQLEAQDVVVKNGLEMLYAQAEKSWELWMRKD